jgi:hypothetical protein
MKHGVQIIECLVSDDPGSEGRGLKNVFDLMEVESKLLRVDSIDQLLEAIADSKFKFAHIATHGSVNRKTDKFKGWWTPSGIGDRHKVSEFDGRFKQTAIVSTACKSGASSFGKYVVNKLGSRYFIGPERSLSFSNSILFSHIFYHKLFNTKDGVSAAFDSYLKNYKNPNGFKLYVNSSFKIR